MRDALARKRSFAGMALAVLGCMLALCVALPQSAWADEDTLSCHPEQASEGASFCHPEQASEGASSCHPEQASEASASKDLDANVAEEAGSNESANASADDSDNAAAATDAVVNGGSGEGDSSLSAQDNESGTTQNAEGTEASTDGSDAYGGSAEDAEAAESAEADEGTEADESDADGSDDVAASDEDDPSCHPEQASEGASSCDPEQASEDASSCHPEQASEASASKDLDASVEESQAGADATIQADAATSENAATAATEYVNMYRLYNPNSGEHFYTSSLKEMTSVCEAGWRYEGVGWVAPKASAAPVYRLYNPNAGDHHYTTSKIERDYLVSVGWNDEGIGWYSEDSDTGIAVLRQYNPNAIAGAHNFTKSSDENDSLISAGWSGEGVAWYASSQPTQSIQGRWIVTSAWGGLERYWLDSTATIASDRLIDPTTALDSGAGYRAYATSTGAVVRGSYDSGAGYVYLADEDGRLVSGTTNDWLVTDVYAGSTRRYYLVSVNGIIVAKSSFFMVDGCYYYGLGGVGYVLCNGMVNGSVSTDAEGKISGTGWLVTDELGQGLQRYWVKNGQFATSRLITPSEGAGYYAYATAAGYVVRGKYAASATAVYLADNDGRLEDPGWVVTGDYDDGTFQRYYIDETTHACTMGEFSVGHEGYLGLETVGYVLRGSATVDGVAYYADDDGELALTFTSSVASAEEDVAGDVVSTVVGQTPYLFLPSYADLSSVSLGFDAWDGAQTIYLSLDGANFTAQENGAMCDLSGLEVSDGVRIVWYRTLGSTKNRTLAIMVSANVRAMYLVSDDPVNQGRAWVESSSDHTNKATGSMLLVDPDGTVVYNGSLTQIKGRGNATWTLDKKPYQIKLSKKTDLLETGDKSNKAKTWVLLADRNDASALQNAVAFQLAKALGLESTPEFAHVDLYYDGEYRGSYLLCEKIEINSGRVDIYDLEDANEDANEGVDLDELPTAQAANKYGNTFQYVSGMNNPDDITGGYLLEQDEQYYAAERCWFTVSWSGNTVHIVVKGPESCSYEEMLYISEFVQEAINNSCADTSLRTEGATPSDYVDLESLAKVYLVNQFAKNEGWGASSAYFYLPSIADASDGYAHVLYAGPVWDFDTAFGLLDYNANEINYLSKPEYLYPFLPRWVWYENCPEVEEAVAQYATLANELTAYLAGLSTSVSIEGYKSYADMVSEIYASQLMNEKLWGYSTFSVCLDPYDTYAENAQRLATWMATRAAWLAENGWI